VEFPLVAQCVFCRANISKQGQDTRFVAILHLCLILAEPLLLQVPFAAKIKAEVKDLCTAAVGLITKPKQVI
jgi:hypothetical protein